MTVTMVAVILISDLIDVISRYLNYFIMSSSPHNKVVHRERRDYRGPHNKDCDHASGVYFE